MSESKVIVYKLPDVHRLLHTGWSFIIIVEAVEVYMKLLLFLFQLRSIPTTFPDNDNGVAFLTPLLAQLRRADLRTRPREPTPSCIYILCVRGSAKPRDFPTAQELLLCPTGAYGRMGWWDDSYEWRELLLKVKRNVLYEANTLKIRREIFSISHSNWTFTNVNVVLF